MQNESRLKNKELSTQIDKYQAMLLPFAYNIIGDVMEAEDIVQDLLNHHFLANATNIQNPSHYLIRSVINRAINQKKLLRNRMESYPGKWLPTPVITEENIYASADRSKILHYSLLVLLERLNPKERAVFILKETFDFTHEEIGELLDINTEHSRQILKRSKEKITLPVAKAKNPRDNQHLVTQLADAITSADIETTKRLLAEDIQSISDGGPHMRAARKVLVGPERVSKFLRAIYGKYYPDDATTEFLTVNHLPAILFRRQGEIFRCMIFQIEANRIQNVFIIVNPDKLKALQVSISTDR
jgi:RNA polymerase sigma-70 factor (ECF subfamily)